MLCTLELYRWEVVTNNSTRTLYYLFWSYQQLFFSSSILSTNLPIKISPGQSHLSVMVFWIVTVLCPCHSSCDHVDDIFIEYLGQIIFIQLIQWLSIIGSHRHHRINLNESSIIQIQNCNFLDNVKPHITVIYVDTRASTESSRSFQNLVELKVPASALTFHYSDTTYAKQSGRYSNFEVEEFKSWMFRW